MSVSTAPVINGVPTVSPEGTLIGPGALAIKILRDAGAVMKAKMTVKHPDGSTVSMVAGSPVSALTCEELAKAFSQSGGKASVGYGKNRKVSSEGKLNAGEGSGMAVALLYDAALEEID